jgi:TolB-like protein/Flp pilus assembly protein TadD
MRVSSLLAELKRRHVLKVVGAYLVAAWVVIEVSSTVLPELYFPQWVLRLIIALAAAGLPVVVVVSWVFDLTKAGIVRTDAVREADLPLPPPPDRGPSVAVLPFVNLSADPENEYFSDGITEDIIARLSGVEGLRVISRTSAMRYRNTDRNLREIGRELAVKTVLEGSVRRAAGRVRIVAQLIDAAADDPLWSEAYDRDLEDIFAIQTDVAHRIAGALEARLPGAEPSEQPETTVEAYELYLKGRYAWNQRTPTSLRRSVELLEAAVAADPEYALAYAALADAYLTLSYGIAAPKEVMPKAESAASRALELDPSLAEGLGARATVRALYRWDWDSAERDFRRAIELDPQYPTARAWYALNGLAPGRRFDAAREQLEAARRVDPLSPVIGTCQGILSFFERSYDRAAEELLDVLESDPAFALGHFFLGQVRTEQDRHDEALAVLGRAVELTAGSAETTAALGYAQARAGDVEAARELVGELEARSDDGYVSGVHLAQVHIGLGESTVAQDWLERAMGDRASELAWLAVRPVFDPLSDEPRFRKLLEAVGLSR